MSGNPYNPYNASNPPAAPYSPSQLGVRPAPALVQQLLVGAFGWMFAALLLSAGVTYLVASSPQLLLKVTDYWFLIVIGQLILGIGIQVAIRKISPMASLGLFFVYAASMGLTLGVLVWSVLQVEGGEMAVTSAFLSSAAAFGGAALYGGVAKRDLTKLGGILFMGVFGIVIALIVNLFLHSDVLFFWISVAGVVIFTALTAYDVQNIKNGNYAAFAGSPERASILAALHLYLNFINLFIFFLRIFGGGRN
jgi:FtsH-binding integral membrane protein